MNKITNRIHELNRFINEIAHPDDVEVDLVVENDTPDININKKVDKSINKYNKILNNNK